MTSDHFSRRARGGDMDMHTHTSFRQRLNVALGTYQFKVLVYGLSLKLGHALIVPAQVAELQLAKASYAGRDDSFANTL